MSNPYAEAGDEQSGRRSAHRAEMLLRVQIITGAMIMGAVPFAIVALVLRMDDINSEPDIIAVIGLVISAFMFLLHFIVPNLVAAVMLKQIQTSKVSSANDEKKFELLFPVFQTRQIIACAMLEGAAFLNIVFFIVSGFGGNLIAAAILIGLIALRFPTATKVDFWVQDRAREMEMRMESA